MKLINSLILALLFVVVFSGCTKKQSSEYGLKISETLRVSLDTEPPTLDWMKATDTTSSSIVYNIMEGMVAYNLNDPELSLKPALGLSWSASKDARVWTFKIRKGVQWSDGVELTAQHFIDAWQRLLTPKTASEYAYFMYGIKNAKAFNEGKIKDPKKLGLKINGAGDLIVTLEQPMSFFPYLLSHTSTFPARLDIINKFGDNWTDPKNIVTLGAFKLKIWDHDKAMVLERSPNYYGTPTKTKYVLGYIINEKSTVLNLFDAGKIDAIKDLPAIDLPHLRKKPEYHSHGILGIYYLGYNVKRAPFDNLKVRKAISMAIDRQEITKMLNAGHVPIKGWIPVGMFGFEKKLGVDFNIKTANRLLDEAGFKDRSKFPTIFYGFNTNENHQRIAENVQAQLKRNLNITVEIKNEEWKVYLSTLKSKPPHIFRLGWLADFPDPDNFLNMLTSTSDNNHTGWVNPEFDRQIINAAQTVDKKERKRLYKKAQKIIVETDLPVLPVYSMVEHLLVSKRVKNYPMNPMSNFIWKDVELVK